MKFTKYIVASMLVAVGVGSAHAEWNDSIRYRGELRGVTGVGKHAPFWLSNNQYGLSSIEPNNAYIRLGLFHDMDTTKRFTWGAGADLVTPYNFTSDFVVQQLYAEAKYRCLNLMVGAKEIAGFMQDRELSSGDLLFSSAARPIPQVRAGIFDYADVWGTHRWMAVKGYVAFGKFTDSGWIQRWVDPKSEYALGTLFHSKALFLKFGDARKFPLEVEWGLEMASQFGGKTHLQSGRWLKHGEGLRNWLCAFVPLPGGKDSPEGERTNVEGNWLGTWNWAVHWKSAQGWALRLYYQHFFEDHSMLWVHYPWRDGLYGLQVKMPENRWVNNFIYEFVNMKDQSGPVYWDHSPDVPEQVSGRDDYYNHYLYNGWEHWGMAVGNPISVSPIYNPDHNMYFYSNRCWGHHVGVTGQPTDQIGYKLLSTYQRSWGHYDLPFKEVEDSYSMLLQLNFTPKAIPGWRFEAAYAMDLGNLSLIGKNYGLMLSISKSGWIFNN